jgi:hypothetical protein
VLVVRRKPKDKVSPLLDAAEEDLPAGSEVRAIGIGWR